MEPDSQEEHVKRLETKLAELREQRIKVDEANEILRKKLQTLTKHLDDLDLKHAKVYGSEEDDGEAGAEKTKLESNATTVEDSDSTAVPALSPDPDKSRVQDDQTNTNIEDGSKNGEN